MKFFAPILLCAIPSLAAPSASEDVRGSCPDLPTKKNLTTSITTLPDPFLFSNGKRVSSQHQWNCRQKEISQLIQDYELGAKPARPTDFSVAWDNVSKVLVVAPAVDGKKISFNVTIKYPSTTTGAGPFPAIIAIGGASIPLPASVASITFVNDEIASQYGIQSRGKGLFYDLYGSDASAGAMIAWAWATSRIIDALEMTPDAQIDTSKIAVTGCSRNGKGALVVGAFDKRIALTIPQESGTGGAGCWRLADDTYSQGINIQTAHELVGENSWCSKDFDAYATSINLLPFDHHMLAGLVAPRGLLVIENNINWLGPQSTYGCMKTANKIWQALGAQDNMGFTEIGVHSHCRFPAEQQSILSAYISQFLFDTPSNTSVMATTVASSFNETKSKRRGVHNPEFYNVGMGKLTSSFAVHCFRTNTVLDTENSTSVRATLQLKDIDTQGQGRLVENLGNDLRTLVGADALEERSTQERTGKRRWGLT
ncbi:hypothetical protein G7Y89_g4604 [Cudoniella acicularis]|uniref:(4-O-methyl)-D-glucuronate--lignin esterase n=1 Tax=Cudoniella acicularis TaxID=354080 RepID=A0A8H4W4T7_9HELO|nr:hypothetical protein G7Y89_g4604 [Cudoniella acicularis]